jgi:hypothetical protein
MYENVDFSGCLIVIVGCVFIIVSLLIGLGILIGKFLL